MQTFLPLKSFAASACVLDYRRLGKQRIECKQLLSTLHHEITSDGSLVVSPSSKAGWVNHPAAKMWCGYEQALALYYQNVVAEWIRRGYNNTMPLLNTESLGDPTYPPWFGDEAFHASHRSNLLRKDPDWYGQFGWTEPSDLPYVWPVA